MFATAPAILQAQEEAAAYAEHAAQLEAEMASQLASNLPAIDDFDAFAARGGGAGARRASGSRREEKLARRHQRCLAPNHKPCHLDALLLPFLHLDQARQTGFLLIFSAAQGSLARE